MKNVIFNRKNYFCAQSRHFFIKLETDYFLNKYLIRIGLVFKLSISRYSYLKIIKVRIFKTSFALENVSTSNY